MATPQRKKMAVKTEEEKAEDILSTGSTIKGMFHLNLWYFLVETDRFSGF